ncbi:MULTISPECIES: GH92 family glycosyl hydrolase [Vibrio harveyi group]|uniref:GH92 family glycosyl hydrolase n=1 Tax=Vibrio harveyi group TaxID=717610 RepID=UPI00083B72B8|nr:MULTISPECIES: GH92 family glycosyl hydrolase [Vibrio harveyi group]EJG0940387.1 GH92 family glycosyl hydrolase [Vibrio parahaemolyticus O1]EGQ7681710.1 glycoside hydrolase family 92 protein [Vibrio parahaemolyticus]EGQ8939088.1 glycoside hydrolase family 92 protein [Vibrio parahaemolyticus]EGQ8948001.1 glycoside hydrolase family 92 protein [Vibrio parahaemolyticus]EGQ8968585.1 glycoside hydrolase family 92 protein [Vibrio parahaemolyticus]
MFKRNLISLAILVGLTGGLAGCNSDNDSSSSLPGDPIVDLAVLKYVDPMIGTAASGHTFPGATVPAGMVQLSPDTFIGSNTDHESGLNPWHSASGYWDSSNYETGEVVNTDVPLYGFSHTHLSGTGATDLGDILVLPYADMANTQLNSFDKANEEASAGYYKTKLNQGQIEVELSATKRVGLHKYTFAEGADRNVKFDLGHTLMNNNGKSLKNKVEVVDEYTIRGRKTSTGWFQGQDHQGQDIFFYAKFNQPIAKALLGEQDLEPTREMRNGAVYSGDDLTAYLNFGTGEEPIEIRVGISPVNWQGAQKNLEAEAPSFDLAQVKEDAEYAWAEKLAKIKVEGGTDAEKTNFYTGMYHMMIAPIEFYDVDGQYVDMLGTVRTLKDGDTPNYSIYSTWDTFRAVHPMWTIIDPDQATLYVKDLIRKSNDEFGLLPKWEGHGSETGTMIGYPSAAILGDAVTKGLIDAEQAYTASVKSARYTPHEYPQIHDDILSSLMAGQLNYHEKEQCVRYPNWNSVSYSLEFSFYDWTIAEMAKAAGDMDAYEEFKARSYNSLKHWDAKAGNADGTGFFVPTELKEGDPCALKYASTDFDPYKSDAFYYTEGNAWQWQWAFMQDLDKLTEIMGGTQGLNDKLNNLFTADPNGGEAHQDMTGYIGQYIHGNEPSHHVIYLYNRTEESYKAQEYLDQVYDQFYKPTPDGIIGNEDVGQMSAWYLMSALGFYQISPTDPTYSIGRPIFDKATVDIGSGTFTVTAENNGPDNMYIKEVTINGKPLDVYNTFQHSEFKAGGELHFVMTADKSEAMQANLGE